MADLKQLSIALVVDASRGRSELKQFGSDVGAFNRQLEGIGDSAGKGLNNTNKHLGDTRQQLVGVAQTAGSIGNQLSIGVTLPLVAAGTAATKMSMDYDTAFAHMVGLAGVPQAEVDSLKQSVLGLADDTGKAPQELAEGLYFIESAGIHGAAALDTLTSAAKASAAGMGDTQTLADALTSVISAYGQENITAAHATDVLTVAVRDGKAEASSFAPELGALLPMAVQLKIPFDQVAGALAFLTRSSGDTALSATQLRGVLNSLLAPSQETAKALGEAGISVEDMQNSLATKGLLPTLEMLRQKLGDNTAAMATLFPDVRGLNGALLLTADGGRAAAEVLGDTANSAGAAGDAFDAVAGTDSFKLQQSLAKLEVQLIKVGESLTPLVTDIASFGSTVAGAFSAIPEPGQKVLLVFAGLLAAMGPMMTVWSRGVLLWDKGGQLLDKIRDALTAHRAATVADTEAIGANTAVTETNAVAQDQLALSLDGVAVSEEAVAASGMSMVGVFAAVVAAPVVVVAAFKTLSDALGLTDDGFSTFTGNLKAADDGLHVFTDQVDNFNGFSLRKDLDDLIAKTPQFATALQHAGVTTLDVTKALGDGADAWDLFTNKVSHAKGVTDEDRGAFFAMTKAAQDNASQAITTAVAQGKLTQAQVDGIEKTTLLHDGSVNYVQALAQLSPQIQQTTDATDQNTTSKQENTTATQLSAEAQDQLKGAIAGFPKLLDDLSSAFDRQYKSMSIGLDLDSHRKEALDNLRWTLGVNGVVIDANTGLLDNNNKKNRDSISAAEDFGQAIQALMDQRFKETGSTQAAIDAGNLYVENLHDQLRQAGYTEDQVAALIRTMNLTPEDINTTFNNNAAEQQLVIGKYLAEIDKLPPNVQTWIEAEMAQGQYGDALQSLNTVLWTANSIPRDVTVAVHARGDVVQTSDGSYFVVGSGGLKFNRWGGIEHAASGLVAGVYNRPAVMFAEPETGGEAYIPRLGNRARNMDILRTAARWNNASIVDNTIAPQAFPGAPMAPRGDGGWSSGAASAPTIVRVVEKPIHYHVHADDLTKAEALSYATERLEWQLSGRSDG